ncbi:MAG: hypothetical protein ACOCRK_10230 [bacterium]
MTMNNITTDNDLCYPPDCPEDFNIQVLSYGPPSCNHITWKIHNVYDVNYTTNDSKVKYSIDNQNLNNVVKGKFDGKKYYCKLKIDKYEGMLYFKVAMEINNNFYESDIKEFNLSECEDGEDGEEYVKARAVDSSNDNILWVPKKEVPEPEDKIYFRYGENLVEDDTENYEEEYSIIPDPMTWDTAPSYSDGSIFMEADEAYAATEVEYYFECTDGPGNDSGWQDSRSYTDSFSEEGTYSYRVKARDKNYNDTESDWSTIESVEGDTDPPSPIPEITAVEWEEDGTYYEGIEVTNSDDIEDDHPPIEFKYECYNDSGYSSPWTTSDTYYTSVSTSNSKEWTWQVKARDAQGNETELSDLTQAVSGPKPDWAPEDP